MGISADEVVAAHLHGFVANLISAGVRLAPLDQTQGCRTKDDARFLTRAGSLVTERLLGNETGSCPYTAIRDETGANLAGQATTTRPRPSLPN